MARKFFGRHSKKTGNTRGRGRRARRQSSSLRNSTLGFEPLEDRRMLAAGDLDTTFGTGGRVTLDLGIGKNEELLTSIVQSDGKILAAGAIGNPVNANNRDFLVARFNSNGSLDTSFGTGGYFTLDVSDLGVGAFANQNDEVSDMLIQPDGKILLSGTAIKNQGSPGSTTNTAVALVRLTSTGQLDTSFGTGGKVLTVLRDASNNRVNVLEVTGSDGNGPKVPLALQSDNKIVVGATVQFNIFLTRQDWAVLRYDASGTLDTSFDVDGVATTDFDSTAGSGNANDRLNDIVIQPADQKIVAVGWAVTDDINPPASQDFALARYNTNGSLDTSFDGDGKVTTDLQPANIGTQSSAMSVALGPGNQLIVAGWSGGSNRDFAIARYNANGGLDTSFGTTSLVQGTRLINLGTANEFGADVILQPQPDGKYVIGGWIGDTAATNDFALARLNLNGTLDTTFSGDGLTNTHFAGTTFTRMGDVSMGPDGKIVAVGYVSTGPQEDLAMARWESGLVLNTISGLASANEGATYTLNLSTTDPSTTGWTIQWGDLTSSSVGNVTTATHVYADGPNNYTITANVLNSSGSTPVNSVAVAVQNVAPTLVINQPTVAVNEGTTAANSGTYGDVSADTVTITASIGAITYSAGTWNWSYNSTDDLQQTVTLTATDEDGGVTVRTFGLVVNNLDPTITVNQTSVAVNQGQTATNSGTFSDVPADTVTVVASVGTITQVGNTWSWSYNTASGLPPQTVTVAAIDDNNGWTPVTFTLAVKPNLTAVGNQTVNENAPLNITNIGSFTDVVQGADAGPSVGLDANDFTAIGAFDPATDVLFNTDTLVISGGFTGTGTTVTANAGFGNYQIAVFTFNTFELDAGVTIRATGSRPLALLSQSNMLVNGVIDVSATASGSSSAADFAGPGGGRGGDAVPPNRNGDPATGAPIAAGGQLGSSGLLTGASGSGGGGGGVGGHGEVDGVPRGTGGVDYVNLQLGIQGGSGGSASGMDSNTVVMFGGSGGGGIELGAANKVTISSSGQVLAKGTQGRDAASFVIPGTGGGGGAGGNILVHATNIANAGLLSTQGGKGGNGRQIGGGGAGGDITFAYSNIGTFSDTGIELLTGGAGGGIAAAAGENGDRDVITVAQTSTPVLETFTYSINWGDSSSPNTGAATIDVPGVNVGNVVQGSFDGSHTYADNGVYTVALTVTDSHGGSDTKSFLVTVNNLNPTLTVNNASVTINEGQTASNSGTFGDVPADTVTVSASIGSVTFSSGVWNWSYTAADSAPTQSVTITASDEDGGSTSTTFNLTVNNLAPTLTVDQASLTINEGQTATNSGTYGDVPADTVSIVASIGLVSFAGGLWNWSYNGTDDLPTTTVTITASDEDGGSTNVTFDLSVNNVNPTLTVDNAAVTANEGQTATNSGTFGDVPADTVTLAASIGTVTGSAGAWTWSYNATDDLPTTTVTITASDDDGGSTSVTFDLSVNNVAPTLTVDNASVTASEGQTATNTGTFGDVPADTVTLVASIGTVVGSAGAWTWSYNATDDLPTTTVTITASDEDGGSTNVTFDLAVNNVDPSLTVDNASVTANEGQTATNTGTFGDVPADTVTLAASIGTVVGSAGTWIWSYAAADNAPTQTVTIIATDEDGGSTSVTFDLTVNNVNPTLTVNNASVTVNEGQSATNSGTFGDVPADTVTLAASIGTVTGSAGAWTWSYAAADNAPTQTVTITATDEDGGSTSVTFDLTVSNVNPTLTVNNASVTVNEGQTATNSGTFGDVPADTVSLAASIGTVTGSAGAWSWSYNATDNLPTTTVTIIATDEDGGSTSVTFDLAVNNVNPTLTVNNASVTVNEGQTATNSGTFGDVPADTVTLSASIGTVIGTAGNWSWAYNATDNAPTQTVTITAADEDGGSTSVTFNLTVSNVNPTLTVNNASVTVNEGQTATNSGTFGDVPADTVSLSASIGTVTGTAGNWSWSYNATDNAPTQAVTITASDEDGGSTSVTFNLTVNNVAPTLTRNNASVTVNEGQTATNSGTFGDVPADTVTLSASIGTVTGSAGNWTWSYNTTDNAPTQTVTITATDEDGGSASVSFSLTVNNVSPMLTLSGASTVNEGSPYTLNLSSFDPGADTITSWTINWGDSTQVISGNPSTVTHTYADGVANYTISATGTDEDGTFPAGNTVNVTVQNVAPTVNSATFSVAENSPNGTAVGTVTANDPGTDTLSFSIVGGTGAAAFAINSATGQITVTNGLLLDYNTSPTLTLNVQVSDGEGGTATGLVTINVTRQPTISGVVYVDVNHNGLFDANEPGIDGVTIRLLDQNGNPVLDSGGHAITAVTNDGGLYVFTGLQLGTYQVAEVQPTGVADGAEQLGSLGGTIVANDRMQLTLGATDAFDYAFAEIGQQLRKGDAATIGFWQNKNGQALIAQGGTQLAVWLTSHFGNIFGNTLVGMTGSQVATFYRDQVFKGLKLGGPAKVDAQFMAVALATYFTDRTLAGTVAAAYGFNVTDTGIGTNIVNVGTKGAAFNVANGTDRTIMQLLLATNSLTDQVNTVAGFDAIYDKDGNGSISSAEATLRTMANDIFSFINETGDI